jgi:hypothetical protein
MIILIINRCIFPQRSQPLAALFFRSWPALPVFPDAARPVALDRTLPF